MIHHYYKFKKVQETNIKLRYILTRYSNPVYGKIRTGNMYLLPINYIDEKRKRKVDFIMFDSNGLISSCFIPLHKNSKYAYGIIKETTDLLIYKIRAATLEIFVLVDCRYLLTSMLCLLFDGELEQEMKIFVQKAMKFQNKRK